MPNDVLAALHGVKDTLQEGGRNIGLARIQKARMGLDTAYMEDTLQRNRVQDERAQTLFDQSQADYREPFLFREIAPEATSDLPWVASQKKDIEKILGAKYDSKTGGFLKNGKLMTRAEGRQYGGVLTASMLANASQHKVFLNQKDRIEEEMERTADPRRRSGLTQNLSKVNDWLGAYEKNPVPFLEDQINVLLRAQAQLKAQGFEVAPIGAGIERLNKKIEHYRRGELTPAQQAQHNATMANLNLRQEEIKKRIAVLDVNTGTGKEYKPLTIEQRNDLKAQIMAHMGFRVGSDRSKTIERVNPETNEYEIPSRAEEEKVLAAVQKFIASAADQAHAKKVSAYNYALAALEELAGRHQRQSAARMQAIQGFDPNAVLQRFDATTQQGPFDMEPPPAPLPPPPPAVRRTGRNRPMLRDYIARP